MRVESSDSVDCREQCCGALRSPEDPDDCIYEQLAQGPIGYYLSEFPEEYDLRKHAQTSRDQGSRGTCAAFTAAAIKEIQESRDCNFNEWMSPEFIYYHRENKPASGMYGRNVFQILQRIGSVPESLYPYSSVDSEIPPPQQELYETAAKYRIANFARVNTCDGLKRALLELGPGYLQLPLYSSRPYFWRAIAGEKCNGGHAVTVVGFNKEGFILKNSWGATWNGDGCIVFPYTEWGIQWECWISVDEKTESNGSNVQSGVSSQTSQTSISSVNGQNNKPPVTSPSINIRDYDKMRAGRINCTESTERTERMKKKRKDHKNDKCVIM